VEIFKEVVGKSYKRLKHTFEFTIRDDPEENNFEIGNINLHYRKKAENVYLVFGSYDLVYCFKEKQQDYRVKCMTKLFYTVIPVRPTREIQKDEDIHISLSLNLKDVKVVASNFIKGSLGEFLKKSIAIIPKKVTAEVVLTVMIEIRSHIEEEYQAPEIIKPEGIVDTAKALLPAEDMQEWDEVREDEVLQQECSQLRGEVFKEDEDLESNGRTPIQAAELQADKKEQLDKLQQKKIENESFQLRYAEEYRKLANYGWFEKQYMANLMPRIKRKPSKVKANNKGGYG